MIEFINVTRRYGDKTAVRGLNLVVPRGELFALLGRNGAGKTTSIKMLVGLLRPDEGVLRVGGHNVVEQPRQAARAIGYAPDQAFLYDKLTGREFLEFAAEMRGLTRPLLAERIDREAERFELGGFLDDLTETYSHGMRQRLVLASALLHDPQAIVIDEPMVGLDPRSVRMVKDLLRDQAAAGAAVFMSTHTLAIAEEIADRIGIVERGELRFLGTVAELHRELALPHTTLEHLFLELTDGSGNGNGSAAAGEFAARERER